MERSEPSLVPEWLKGSSGGLASPQAAFFQDDAGGTFRSRTTQGSHLDYDSPRGLGSSDRGFVPSTRRSNNSNLLGAVVDRENYSQGRLHPSLNRSNSSKHSYDIQDRERDWEGERSIWQRDRDFTGADGRKRERDRSENGKLRLSIPGKPESLETDAGLRRSHSMGLSTRTPEGSLWKVNESLSASTTNMQKAVFERNFPSLGIDDKPGGNSGSTPISSPRPAWQSPSRSDLGRATSPGFGGAIGGPLPGTPLSINGGSGGGELWNSALADVPSLVNNLQNGSVAVNGSSSALTSSLSSLPSTGAAATVLNMAEALSQPPPRVRTPPQVSVESQRLEELALKQSRQLIPMTPSLPKAMSFSDKSKSKAARAGDGSGSMSKSNQLPSNPLNRSSYPSRPEAAKHSQGKLLVLKASKDGGISATAASKSEGGNNPAQMLTHGSTSGTSALGPAGRRAPSQLGPVGPNVLAGVRTKDSVEDKRPSLQAQNRSDFFKTLRKKAAENGNSFGAVKSEDSLKMESVDASSSEAVVSWAGDSVGLASEAKENGGIEGSPLSNGDLENVELANADQFTPPVDYHDESVYVGSQEEEKAFMRSLGWEENAEGIELTEEEINEFYKMRDERRLNDSKRRVEPTIGSMGSLSSLSSSDSDSDDDAFA